MTFSFHPEAEEEFRSAIDHYECREAGLGYEFSLEVLTAIHNIVTHPSAWPVIEDDVRRCLVNRFPFGVLYSLEPTSILVLAVMHHRRRPGYWKNR
jgi:plasmid stabilization system protein ParE